MKVLKGLGFGVVACVAAGVGYTVYLIKKNPELKNKVEHTLKTAQEALIVRAEVAQERALFEAQKAEEQLQKARAWAEKEWQKVDK